MMDHKLAEWLENFTHKFHADERYSGAEVSRDGSHVDIWWFGEAPAELIDLLEGESGDVVRLRAASNKPSDLRRKTQELMSDPSLQLVSVAFPLDSSRLDLCVSRDAGLTEKQLRDIEEAVRNRTGLPIRVSVGTVVAV